MDEKYQIDRIPFFAILRSISTILQPPRIGSTAPTIPPRTSTTTPLPIGTTISAGGPPCSEKMNHSDYGFYGTPHIKRQSEDKGRMYLDLIRILKYHKSLISIERVNTGLSFKSNLYEMIISKDNIFQAYRSTQKNGGNLKRDAIRFNEHIVYNLLEIVRTLKENEYIPDKYTSFTIYKPKQRIIEVPSYKDKIIQYAIYRQLKDEYFKSFIYDSYACIEIKGVHRAIQRIKDFSHRIQKGNPNPWVLKVDIKKYFYSIDRNILKDILRKKIRCWKTLDLLCKIINSYEGSVGIPLGSPLSQLFANIYLNELDQHCKRVLGVKYYARYMDDIVILTNNKAEAKRLMDIVVGYIGEQLNLECNKKTKVFPLKRGISSLGFRIFPTHVKLRSVSKQTSNRRFKRLNRTTKIPNITMEQMANSWLGHVKHWDCYKLISQFKTKYPNVFERNDD